VVMKEKWDGAVGSVRFLKTFISVSF